VFTNLPYVAHVDPMMKLRKHHRPAPALERDLDDDEKAMSPMELQVHQARKAIRRLVRAPPLPLPTMPGRDEGWEPTHDVLLENFRTVYNATAKPVKPGRKERRRSTVRSG